MTSKEHFQVPSTPGGPRIIIMGGGIGGITSAIALKQQLGFHNFTLYEQSDDLGGTWNLNTYPGCASDVATHWYSLSTDLNPDWGRSHVSQPELKAYWKDLAGKYRLNGHVSLFTKVVGAEWDASQQLYRVEVQDVRNDHTRIDYANGIISAIGVLDVPSYPKELKGIRDTFKGEHFHSARWNHAVDLHNKRVAVIGNGCSAAQFVPVISQDPTTQVVSFCRTPAWFIPGQREQISESRKRVFKYLPFAMRLYRWLIAARQESTYFFIMTGGRENKKRQQLMEQLRGYMKAVAPAEYIEKLTPSYPAGCKRFIIDVGYYESLHRPNNDLNFDGIAEVTEKGIITKEGQHLEFDVIIQATGFITDEYPINLRGVDGITMQDFNRTHGGPTAYRGTTVPGFPNFFMVLGANTGTGHGSVVFTEEVQINYIMQLLKPVVSGLASSYEVTTEASEAWNTRIDKKLSTSVWSYCRSWYRVGSAGRNTVIWPGSLTEQWWLLRTPVWSHYKAVGAQKWERRRRLRKVWRFLEFGGIFAALAWSYLHPEDSLRLASQAKNQMLSQLHVVLSNIFH